MLFLEIEQYILVCDDWIQRITHKNEYWVQKSKLSIAKLSTNMDMYVKCG